MADMSADLVRQLREPRGAAIAGIVFSLILTAVLVLLRSALQASSHPSGWITDPSHQDALRVALTLLPYAGIAFLWFIGVIRADLGAREDKLFATVLLSSGVLLVAMLFCCAAVMGALLAMLDRPEPVSDEMVRMAAAVCSALVASVARMAAVFTLALANIARRTGIAPRWLRAAGFAVGIALLVGPTGTVWLGLAFCAWILLVSLHMLAPALRRSEARL